MPIPCNKTSEFFIPEDKKENVETTIDPLTQLIALLLTLPTQQIIDAQRPLNDETSDT